MEAYLQGVVSIGTDSMGEKNAKIFMPLIATLGLIIFVANMMGIIQVLNLLQVILTLLYL